MPSSFNLHQETLDALRERSRRTRISQAELLDHALRQFLKTPFADFDTGELVTPPQEAK